MYIIYDFPKEEIKKDKFNMKINGESIGLHSATVSAAPINRRWPGHQRQIDQTKEINFAMFSADESVSISLRPDFTFKTVKIRPLSFNIIPEIKDGEISFSMTKPSYIAVEFDGGDNMLYIFSDKEKKFEKNGDVIYFGKGFHDAGMIELKSNQTLFIDEGAVVYGCIHAIDADNISIVGNGILDNSKNKEEILFETELGDGSCAVSNAKRIDTITIEYCTNVTIDGITIRDSLLYNIRPIACENLDIQNVKIIGNWRYNSDGIDMHNCTHVHISDCFIQTYDDSICVKGFDPWQKLSDLEHNGKRYDIFEDIVVKRCVIWNDWGNCLTIGAETRANEIKNVKFCDCDLIHVTSTAIGICNVDYAEVHDVRFENIRIEADGIHQAPVMQRNDAQVFVPDPESDYLPNGMTCVVAKHPEYSVGSKGRGKNYDITYKDIFITAPRMMKCALAGYDSEHMVSDIDFENICLNGIKITDKSDMNLEIGNFVSGINLK